MKKILRKIWHLPIYDLSYFIVYLVLPGSHNLFLHGSTHERFINENDVYTANFIRSCHSSLDVYSLFVDLIYS